jgi:ribosomal protein S18 acetylase RimI-like enzyme
LEAVRRAQEHVRAAGRERLVLAVDERNWPAIRMYSAAGFEAWNRRAVFLRKIDETVRK